MRYISLCPSSWHLHSYFANRSCLIRISLKWVDSTNKKLLIENQNLCYKILELGLIVLMGQCQNLLFQFYLSFGKFLPISNINWNLTNIGSDPTIEGLFILPAWCVDLEEPRKKAYVSKGEAMCYWILNTHHCSDLDSCQWLKLESINTLASGFDFYSVRLFINGSLFNQSSRAKILKNILREASLKDKNSALICAGKHLYEYRGEQAFSLNRPI